MLWTLLALLMIPLTLGLVGSFAIAGLLKYMLLFGLITMAAQLIALIAVTIHRSRAEFAALPPMRRVAPSHP